jgi:hypothetical protein
MLPPGSRNWQLISNQKSYATEKNLNKLLIKIFANADVISYGIAINLYHGDLSLLLVAVRYFHPSQIFANKAISNPDFYR